ncbi:T9SS type A sorting domain-containing protein [Winogradskyella pulchriflava]|uniref:T9SS type A sorting domain-containing protein n=1 Tax=Winogradskyella pulchriflava TaxID=1110688 RepID=A0ABV6Q791_9FLAO
MMKQLYTLISVFSITFFSFSQDGYEFGIVHNSNYNFSVVATPNFDATDTDVSDIGFTLMLPAGNADVVNLTQFNSRVWSATQLDATTLTGIGLGDGTRDGFVLNMPPGQTILSHTSGTSFVLVSFDVSNMPTTGEIEILPNSDPIAQGLSGAVDSFYNSNIDNTSTQDYFLGITAGQGSFMFSTLGIDQVIEKDLSASIYPNPTSNMVSIKASFPIDLIELYNITGKLVLKTEEKDTISVDHLSDGVYLIKIYFQQQVLTKKLVIK